ncbi:MAG: hypothetical protein IKP54_03060 [Bacteroidales bacterium]|nr:hypothetical protein [Bacteroidales bacterium]
MKKILFFSLICLMALSVNAQWVDLGLPSGTLWKDKNEKREFYTYKQAVNKFGKRLPTKEQLEELVTKCQWTWMGCGYKVVGPNGQSIYLPAAGYRSCDGGVNYVNSYGDYWSSTLFSGFAWRLFFFSGGAVHMNNSDQCYGRSVRLVKKKACARMSTSRRH